MQTTKSKPKPERKAKLKRVHCEVDQYLLKRTNKCSLRSILKNENQQLVQAHIHNLLVTVNQLRVVASLVVKHHIYSLFEADKKLDFELDQSYFSKVFTYVRSVTPRGTLHKFEKSLEESTRYVLRCLSYPYFPKVSNQVTQYAAKTMSINIRVHIQMHMQDSFKHWTRNQIRAFMPQEQYDNQRKYMKSYLEEIDNKLKDPEVECKLPFFTQLKDYHDQIVSILYSNEAKEDKDNVDGKDKTEEKEAAEEKDDELVDAEEDEEKKNFDHNTCLQLMWRMKKDSEELEFLTNRKMKVIAVIPQCQMKLGAIQLDTRIIEEFIKFLKPVEGKQTTHEHQRAVWGAVFDLEKLANLRPHQEFNWSVTTDGVSVNVLFAKAVPKSTKKPRKRPKTSVTKAHQAKKLQQAKKSRRKKIIPKTALTHLPNGSYSESSILEKHIKWSNNIRWIGCDPGVRDLLSTWTVGEGVSPYVLGQPEYRHKTGLNKLHKEIKNSRRHYKVTEVYRDLAACPHAKSVSLDHLEKYILTIKQYWSKIWNYQSVRQVRSQRFCRWIKRQKFLDQQLNKMEKKCKTADKTTILLFGNGGSSGFGKVKGGGVKGPVVKIRKLLAKRFPVIHVSEFRTSMCCWQCGKRMLHPSRGKMHAVSYCSDAGHRHMYNRDVDAACKIGYRFLKLLHSGKSDSVEVLGPWSYKFKAEDLDGSVAHLHLYNFAKQLFSEDLRT